MQSQISGIFVFVRYIERYLEKRLAKKTSTTPVVTLTGIRQSGKSTLLQHLFKDWEYVTFDNIQLRDEASRDPTLFLKRYSSKTIFDEVQKVPDLFHEIKLQVDKDKKKRFILSGSSNFLLMSNITESLAGRTALCELYPFSLSESKEINYEESFLEDLQKSKKIEDIDLKRKNKHSFHEIIDAILCGGFPRVHEIKGLEDKMEYFQDYQTTVMEKDFRDFIKVKNLQEFNKLYKMLAFQTGNLLNYSSLSNDLGVSAVTTREYINLLVTSYQFLLLYPYFKKLKTRLVKTPKIYSVDTGLTNFLERITSKDKLLNCGRFGNILENWFITELIKQKSLLSLPPDFYFFRTGSGIEIDLIVDFTGKLIPIEIKSAAKVDFAFAKNISCFIESHKNSKVNVPFGLVIYLGDEIIHLTENIVALPISSIV